MEFWGRQGGLQRYLGILPLLASYPVKREREEREGEGWKQMNWKTRS